MRHPYDDLAKIYSTAFGRDRPKHVGEIFRTELCGCLELVKLGLDVDIALLAAYLCLADRERQKRSTSEVDFRVAFTRPVVDSGRRVTDDRDPEDRHRAVLRGWTGLLN